MSVKARLKRKASYNRYLRNDLAKEEFRVEILAVAYSKRKLDELERKFISKLKTSYPNGYNIQEGGHNGKHSEETKEKMSRSRRGAGNWAYGKNFSKTHRENLSLAKSGNVNGLQSDPERKKRARKVHALRKEGMALREISQNTGLSKSGVSMILSGHRFPDVHSEELSNAR